MNERQVGRLAIYYKNFAIHYDGTVIILGDSYQMNIFSYGLIDIFQQFKPVLSIEPNGTRIGEGIA